MSIIYDALKKVENTVDKKTDVSQPKPAKNMIHAFYIIVAVIGIVSAGIAMHFFSPAKPRQIARTTPVLPAAPIVQETVVPKAAEVIEVPKPKIRPSVQLVVNGIFFSEDKGYALINNRIVEEGDTIEGNKVVAITADSIELEDPQGEKTNLKPSG